MSFRYDFVEVFCLDGVEWREAEVVDDQEIGRQIFFHAFFP